MGALSGVLAHVPCAQKDLPEAAPFEQVKNVPGRVSLDGGELSSARQGAKVPERKAYCLLQKDSCLILLGVVVGTCSE